MIGHSVARRAISDLADAARNVAAGTLVGAIVFASAPATDDPARARVGAHPDYCRACASSSSEMRSLGDAYLIEDGAIEPPTSPDPIAVRGVPPAKAADREDALP